LEPPLCVVFNWVIKRVYIIFIWNTISGSSNIDICLLLFNPYINITFQNSLQLLFCYYYLQIFLFICNLYNSPLCGSTPVLPGYLLLRHSCTWEKTSIFWSCQVFGAVAGEGNTLWKPSTHESELFLGQV